MSDTPKEPTGWIVASDQRMIVRMAGEVMLDVHRKRLDQEPTEEAMWLLCDRIRELEAAALATDAQIAELQKKIRELTAEKGLH